MRSIKKLREKKGVTREELAEFLDISLSSLGYYERKERVPDADTVVRLADYFGVTTDYLLGKSPYRNDADKGVAKKQANNISVQLARVRPEVRDKFLAALESLLLKCSVETSDSPVIILGLLASVMERLGEVQGSFSERVGDATEFDGADSETLQYIVANDITSETFKVALADVCFAIHREIDGLYKNLPPIFMQESHQAVEVSRMNDRAGIEPRHSGEDVANDGDSN